MRNFDLLLLSFKNQGIINPFAPCTHPALRRIAKENPDQLKNLIKEYRNRVEKFLFTQDKQGNTALHFAAYNKDSLQILTNEFREKVKGLIATKNDNGDNVIII